MFACYPWQTALKIGIDLKQYVNISKQITQYTEIATNYSNIARIDDKLLETYINKQKREKLLYGAGGLGFGVLLGLIIWK